MRRIISFYTCLLIGVVCLTGLTSYAERTIDKIKYPPLNEFEMPDAEKIPLDNGIVLYLLEDHELPIINASVRLAAGGYLEPANKIGLASITGTVMRTGGTGRMTGDEIDEALEAIGASVEVSIDNTSGSARMNILSEYIDTGLEILADILRSPQFDEDKINLAKTAERTGISMRNDEPLQVCLREYRKVIYGADSPYARHTEYATINSITRDDLIEFHSEFITPENVMIAVWGDFDKNEMIAKLNKYLGDWSQGSGKVPMLPEVDYEFESAVHYIEKDNITQSTVLIGHIGGLTGDPDYFALIIANRVLGSGAGNRIFNEVRSRKGLAYATGGNFTSNIAYPGIFYNYVMTKFGTTVEATNAVMSEIKRMHTDPPTEEELNRAKESYLNSFVFNFASKGEILRRMMHYDYFNFPQDFLFTVKENIEKVTSDDVIDVARRRFHPDEMHIVVVGKADEFDEPLSVFGQVNTIDITIPSGEVEEDIAINEATLAKGMELLKKAVNACGGHENFAKIHSSSNKATVTLSTPQGEFAIETNSIFVLPNKSKEVMSSPMFGEIVTVSTGEAGWMKQAGQVTDMSADQLADSEKETFRNLLILFKKIDNPDYQAVFVASEELDGKPVDIVKIISLDGEMSFKLALDAATHMPICKMYFGKTIMGPANLIQIISNYKDISGVKVPYAISIETDDRNKIVDVVITEFMINPDIPDGSFDKP